MPLDRNSALREDPDWINQQAKAHNRRITAVYNNTNLISQSFQISGPEDLLVAGESTSVFFEHAEQVIYLGHQQDSPVFAVDLDHLEQGHVEDLVQKVGPSAEFADLRKTGPHMMGMDAAIFAYARGVCYWHQQNRFCGRCSHPLAMHHGGHMRKCSNPDCGREIFPRIDPAVIMVVELLNPDDGIPKCLLGRHKGLPDGVYSTLAGYVEIGETLEEAVAREVLEEAGVKICSAQYMGSQPWPFPASLMLGYRAQTYQQQLEVDLDELEDARWFSVEEILEFGEYDDHRKLALPRKDSIARTLIESWIREQVKGV
jgi:NAD+ diphosphatase